MNSKQSLSVACTSNLESAKHERAIWMLTAASLMALSFFGRAYGEEDPQKALDKQLAQQRQQAALRNAVNSAMSDEQKAAAMKAMRAAQAKDQQKKDMAEYKQMTMENLASVKEMFAKAEDAWKNKQFGAAGPLYSSVAMANVTGSEQMAETARNRMIEMEDLAKDHLKAADDADLKREYVKEVEELSVVYRDFSMTKTREVALRRLVNLKSRPEVSGYVELAQAEGLETDGKLMEAISAYTAISNNPRYENSVPCLKARRKLDDLNTNEETKNKIKTEFDARADREAPVLLNAARNFASNNMPKQAIEKLQTVIDKFPNSKYAEDAKKQIAELK